MPLVPAVGEADGGNDDDPAVVGECEGDIPLLVLGMDGGGDNLDGEFR